MEEYGVLILKVDRPEKEDVCIIQLMTDKDKLVQEKAVSGSGMIRFEYIMPGNYKLKAIHDTNANGKWDSGNYSSGLLPEKVEFFNAPLNLRANWDMQEEWRLEN
jgi:hypothetical protein